MQHCNCIWSVYTCSSHSEPLKHPKNTVQIFHRCKLYVGFEDCVTAEILTGNHNDVISSTCEHIFMRSQNVCCEKL